jgi:hypothetical protein
MIAGIAAEVLIKDLQIRDYSVTCWIIRILSTLNLSDMTSKVCIVAMLVILDLQTIYRMEHVVIFVMCFPTDLYVELTYLRWFRLYHDEEEKQTVHVPTAVLFYILQDT